MNNEQWTMNNEQRAINNEQWTQRNNEQWTMNNEQWAMNNEQWAMSNEQWTMNNEQWTTNEQSTSTKKCKQSCACAVLHLPLTTFWVNNFLFNISLPIFEPLKFGQLQKVINWTRSILWMNLTCSGADIGFFQGGLNIIWRWYGWALKARYIVLVKTTIWYGHPGNRAISLSGRP